MPIAASAAGLGRLTVLSALGQPLNAEVELVSAQKGETLTARLSSIDTYAQANLSFNAALVGARITVERRPNGQPYLKVTTPRPVNEPFADLLIEVNSENGKVTRQYTVLLDPPGYGRAAGEIPPPTVAAAPAARSAPVDTRPLPPQDASASAAAAPGASAEAGASGRAAAPRTAPAARPARERKAESAPSEAGARQYGPVKRGETLGGIARSVQPEGATLEQTLVSLYRQNPDAFIKKNMNLVKSGRILKVPEASEMTSLPQREAVQEVRLQVADFNSFRGRIADRAASAPEAGSNTSGKIGAKVVDRPSTEPRDTVRLSRGEAGGKGGRAGGERLRALEEEAVAREKSLADANERIAALEKTIKDLQRRADLQSGAGAAGKGGTAQVVPPTAPAVKPETPGPIAVAPVIPPPAKAPPAPPVTQPPQADAGKAVPPDVSKAVSADAGKAAPPPDTTTAATDTKAAPPAAKAKAKAPPPAPAPVQEKDFIDTVMDEPLYLAGAVGGAVVVLGGLALVATRRRRAGDSGRVKIAPTLSSDSAKADKTSAPSAAATAAAAPKPAPAPKAAPASPTPPPRPAAAEPTRAATGGAAAAAAALGTAAGAATARAAAPSTGDDNDLDFNAATRAAAPAGGDRARSAAAPRTEPALNKTEAPAAKAEPPLKVGAPAATADSVLNDGPLGRRVDATAGSDARALQPDRPSPRPASPAPAAKPTPPRTPEPTAADSALPDFALDVPPASPPASAEAPAARSQPAPLDFNMDFNLEPLPPIDTPPDAKSAAAAKAPADATDLDFKLGDLNLNFGGTPAPATEAKDDHWYDVQQKFDLAKAYEEMGDKDGARDILQEVLKEGDAEQQAHAKQLLGALG